MRPSASDSVEGKLDVFFSNLAASQILRTFQFSVAMEGCIEEVSSSSELMVASQAALALGLRGVGLKVRDLNCCTLQFWMYEFRYCCAVPNIKPFNPCKHHISNPKPPKMRNSTGGVGVFKFSGPLLHPFTGWHCSLFCFVSLNVGCPDTRDGSCSGSESPRIVTEVPPVCVGVRMSGLGFGGCWLQSLGRPPTTPVKLYKPLQYDTSTLQKPL